GLRCRTPFGGIAAGLGFAGRGHESNVSGATPTVETGTNPIPRRNLLVRSRVLALSGCIVVALALSGCADVSGGNNDAPAAASKLQPSVAAAVKTDIGEYLVRPKSGISSKDVEATMAQLRTMPGV